MSYWDWLYGRGPLRPAPPPSPTPPPPSSPPNLSSPETQHVSIAEQRGSSADPMGSALARALGLVGGQLPTLDAYAAGLPVYVLADYSGRLAPEALEPRSALSHRQGTIGFPWLFLRANTPGGFILESLKLSVSGPAIAAGRVIVWRRPTAPAFVAGVGGPVPTFGGIASQTWWLYSDVGAAGLGDAQLWTPLPSAGQDRPLEFADPHWWIPAGWFLGFSLVDGPGTLSVSLTLRELLDVQPGARP